MTATDEASNMQETGFLCVRNIKNSFFHKQKRMLRNTWREHIVDKKKHQSYTTHVVYFTFSFW
jgi:hypothetical protein